MMQRCSGSQCNVVGPCSCGMYHAQNNSFSMLFSMPHHHKSFDETDMYPFTSPSSSVDCTLSLGTPSTRSSEDDEKRTRHDQRRSGSCMSNFCWDILQTKNNSTPYPPQPHKPSRGNSNTSHSSSNNLANNDPLLARRCANCDTTSTPLWRNGPRGPKSLCNACGIRFKKEERRATAANANNANASSGAMEQHYGYHQNNSWVQTQKMPCFSPANEFRFIEDSDRDSDTGNNIPFLSWRLNVTDRPSQLVHDFTRY
ncbi:GATA TRANSCRIPTION FACTOR 18 [Salix purpurea]|uniref:GATA TRANSCRIPTION FACTOR 18 n=2 Tax=Salix TaxID=40685 RepID=A0A9Q0UN72_9ROSI|nr:GATA TRANSCRIPTION FACTOR 18 [Salix koriyanagi]KAJ6740079.1 GATA TRANSCRIPTION FACTOR 18 [Salix purpurea]